MVSPARSHTRTFGLILCLAAPLVVPLGAQAADPDAPETLVPIGGGYSTESLEGFAEQVVEQATGDTVDLYVVPSSYGDDPADREENLILAQQRTDQVEAACDAVVDLAVFGSGCEATLLPLLQREDAQEPANSAALADPGTDGVYILGGDQVLAMQVLANTPAEANLETGFGQGVVVGGTSAGNAVESRTMGAGYPAPGYPWNALERDMSLVFWGDDLASDERGLSFGSDHVILDQHFYERGRFGRLLSWTAQSVHRYGGAGKLGVGVDRGTGVTIEDDALLTAPFGASSNALIDLTHASDLDWVGAGDTLSVDDVLTHLMAPGTGMTYDTAERTPRLDGQAVEPPARGALPALETRGRGTLWLGGGKNADADSEALADFTAAAQAGIRGSGRGPILLLATGYAEASDARTGATAYREGLAGHGWTGDVQVLVHGSDPIRAADVARAAGVLVIGGDQSLMAQEVADATLRRELGTAVNRPTPVMTDGAATAIMGEQYVTDPDPTTADEAIEMFLAGEVSVADGLGIVEGYTLEPTLTYDYRWGRLYGAAHADPSVVSLGISELTALEVTRTGAVVTGERSAVTVDGSDADWLVGSNGALGAVNVWMDVAGPGDRVG